MIFGVSNPSEKQVRDFTISCIPVAGLLCVFVEEIKVEGLACAILINEEYRPNERKEATLARSFSISKKIQVLKDYREKCGLGIVSGVVTTVSLIALTVLARCGLLFKLITAPIVVLGITIIGIGSVQIYRVNKFIRAQNGA